MRRNAAFAVAAVLMLGLGGCSWLGLGGKDDEKAVEVEVEAFYEPVEAVRNIEIGRTRDGAAVTAYGYAPGLGYSAPELRPRREGNIGPDGYLDFDFFARAPAPGFGLGQGELRARLVRADMLLTLRALEGVRGIRIHGASGGLQVAF